MTTTLPQVQIVGAGLAGCELALQLADNGVCDPVRNEAD